MVLEETNCPFCKETDFDLVGLKIHFEMGYCEKFTDCPMDYSSQRSMEQVDANLKVKIRLY